MIRVLRDISLFSLFLPTCDMFGSLPNPQQILLYVLATFLSTSHVLIPLLLIITLWVKDYWHHPHFTDVETEAPRN